MRLRLNENKKKGQSQIKTTGRGGSMKNRKKKQLAAGIKGGKKKKERETGCKRREGESFLHTHTKREGEVMLVFRIRRQ